MDQRYLRMLEICRPQIRVVSDLEQLLPYLQAGDAINSEELGQLRALTVQSYRADKIIDLVSKKGAQAFSALCVALESTYPHILTSMFTGSSSPATSPYRDNIDIVSKIGPPPISLPPPVPSHNTSTSDSLSSKESQSTPQTLDSEDDVGRSPALIGPSAILIDETPPSGSSSTSGRSLYARPHSLHDYDLRQDGISLIKAELKLITKDSDPSAAGRSYYKMTGIAPPDIHKVAMPKDMPPTLLPPLGGHDYDRIKAECDRMNDELQSLEKKYDQAVKASNMYHQQYKVTKDKLESMETDVNLLKSQNQDLREERSRLQSDVDQLTQLHLEDRSEVEDLRRLQREALTESGAFEGYSAMYNKVVGQYEALKQENNSLRKQYADVVSSFKSSSGKIDRLQEDNERLRKQLDQTKQEKDSAHLDRKVLQQHVTLAIQQANREKNDILRELNDLKSERDAYRLKVTGIDSQNMQISKDVSRLKKERDAAVHEYSLVMSERDSVHKEMEQLQDKLSITQKKFDIGDKEKNQVKDELETVQREFGLILEQRDRAIKSLNELKDKYGERRLDSLEQDMINLDRFKSERTSGRREQNADAKELETLRKEVEKLQSELRDIQQEKEDAKRRCDWAFTERDKIVRERESIRTLCDKIRHERDNAVSKLIEALRDTDELKKQKSDTMKELKDTKEKYEALVEGDARKSQLQHIGHNHSHDSAIDADLQEWETETLQLEFGGSYMKDVGLDLVGGIEDVQFPDNAIYVANIKPESCALGKLKVNDQLLKVNDLDVVNVDKTSVYKALKSNSGLINVTVRRRRLISNRSVFPVHISLAEREFGAHLETGLFVSRILPGSACAKEGSLAIGDRIVNINGHSTENMTPDEVGSLVQSLGDQITLNIIKYSVTPNSSVILSSSPSSGHNLTESSPDGLSISPRSPQIHHRSWTSHSPDSSNKMSLNVKCSGSQTDSLDSPQPSVRNGWPEHDKTSYRTYGHNVNYEHDSKKESYSARVRSSVEYDTTNLHRQSDSHRLHENPQQLLSPESHRMHDLQESRSYDQGNHREASWTHDQKSVGESEKKRFLDKAFSRFSKQMHATDRRSRDARCKSGHPFFTMETDQTTEDEVIEELNAMINQYDHQINNKSKSKDKHIQDPHRKRNGGTWPKCHGPPDLVNPQWLPPTGVKARPPITDMIQDNRHSHFYKHMDSKQPPPPPERNDSFKRSASIKHSPQNSDAAKYSQYGSGHQSSCHSYVPLSVKSPVVETQTVIMDKKDSCNADSPWSTTPQDYNKDSNSMLYSPDSSLNSSTQESLDIAIKSGSNQPDIHKYVQKANRPKSAPNHSHKLRDRADKHRRESQEGHGQRSHSRSRQLQEIAEMLSKDAQNPQKAEFMPQKPTSLDIQPMYSPRPLPHSGCNIKPTTPISPTGYLQDNRLLSSSGSESFCSREKGLVTPASGKSPHSYLPSVPAATQVMRSTNVFHVANSQVVSAHSVGLSSQTPGNRYSSPPGQYLRGSGNSVLNTSIAEVESENHGVYHIGHDRFSSPSPSPSQQSSSFDASMVTSDEISHDYIHHRHPQGKHSHQLAMGDGNSTFPHNRRQSHHTERIRIPSSQSIISPYRSTANSIERVSDRNSPVSPMYEYKHLKPGMSHSLPKTAADVKRRLPCQGETRNIKVEKSIEPLGIQIESGSLGGIFVSTVSDNSLASRAGITIGDQLLEVCGINMRNATKDLAARVLQQCGGSINMLVQYNPNKYHDEDGSTGPSSESSNANTPEICHDRKAKSHRVSNETLTSETVSPHSPASVSPLHSIKSSDSYPPMERRFVMLKKTRPHDSLGVTLVGGNAVGIFIRSVQPNSVSGGPKGLRYGDQILEYNGINYRNVTHEQAAVEMSKPCEVISILAQYNVQKLNKVIDQPGDALYIRALFDHQAENEDQLNFNKNDILFVDNTMFNDMLGVWRAWKVDDSGNKLQCGTIPSKSRLEDDLSLKRSHSEVGEDELTKSQRRGSGSARRSFFRKKKHQRSNSRDSRELNSFSDASINSDSVPMLDDSMLLTYERVERLDSLVCRPVLILAPLAEPLINKLTSESPDKYCRCEAEIIKATTSSLETGQNEGLFVDCKPRPDGQFECVTVQSVREIMSKNRHCLLNVHPDAIEHLHKVNIYPIVLFIKHKTSKEIREVKDTRFLPEKLSNKAVKEHHETFQKYEQKYKRLFSEILPGGNLAFMCRMIKSNIEQEQQKTLWVPSGHL